MPYVKPYTFTTGSFLEANEYNENVSAIAEFYNENISYDDITDASVETKHISRPVVDVITADAYRYFYQSGIAQINNLPVADSPANADASGSGDFYQSGYGLRDINSFINNATFPARFYYSTTGLGSSYASGSETLAQLQPIPKSSITMLVPEEARALLISYSGEVIVPSGYTDNEPIGEGGFCGCIGINGTPISSSFTFTAVMDSRPFQSDIFDQNYYYYWNRRHFTLHHLEDEVSAGIYNISLLGGTFTNACFVGKLTAIAEIIY